MDHSMTGQNQSEIYLSVVIPAYNEAHRIGPTLHHILAYLEAQGWTYEVLVVIDGSRDQTLAEVGKIARNCPHIVVLDNGVNRGKGFSVQHGMLEARGQFVLFSDADLSTPIEEVERLLHCLQREYDVAIASRALPESDIRVRQPWWRQTMGKVFNWFVQLLVLPGIRDSQCGFKCFPRDVVRRIFPRQRIERFGFDVESSGSRASLATILPRSR
jgi:dolichyl-phosphate beta-glucosyltransferase